MNNAKNVSWIIPLKNPVCCYNSPHTNTPPTFTAPIGLNGAIHFGILMTVCRLNPFIFSSYTVIKLYAVAN